MGGVTGSAFVEKRMEEELDFESEEIDVTDGQEGDPTETPILPSGGRGLFDLSAVLIPSHSQDFTCLDF